MTASNAQVSRMLALVPYVQEHAGIPVADIAAEFGVEPRVIHRDLNLLVMTGVGKYGGELIDIDYDALETDEVVYLRDADFMSRPLRLTGSEAAALIVALRTLRASAEHAQIPIIDSALAKLESAALGTVSAPVDVHVDPVDPAIHQVVTSATNQQRRLRITYTGAARDERTDREVDPLRVFTSQGRLYLEAWCLSAEDLRFFRLDRIESAAETGDPVAGHGARPRELGARLFTPGSSGVDALLDVQPAGAWIVDEFDATVVSNDGGTLRVRLHAGDEEWLRRLALRHADVISVVEPASLAADVTSAARQALAAYDEVSPSKE